MSENRTEINQLGEFGLINKLSASIPNQHPDTIKGVGDDAAVIAFGNEVALLSTDYLVEGIHFDLAYTPLKHLGFKAVSVNVSDIAAMYGVPQSITVSLAISNRFSVEALEELYAGIKAACEAYNIDLVGGDTTSSLSGLVLSISVLGKAKPSEVVYRSTAKEGDAICVTGDLGAAYLGLQVLEREKEVFLSDNDMQPELDSFEYQVQRLLKPTARLDVVYALKELALQPTSMIDISDGLASELFHIATQSKVGIEVWDENIPIENSTYERALDFNIGPDACALNGGEDYELLFTLAKEDLEKIKKIPEVEVIGEVKPQEYGMKYISKEGVAHDLKAQGWNHFEKQ